MEEFWGISAEGWTAIGTMAVALITGLLIAGGLYQVSAIRHENKKASTLAACVNYENSPVIYDAVQILWRAREKGKLNKNPRKYRTQLVILLNYLDGIAIGIDQGLYIEDLAWDHMNGIVARHVRVYLDSGIAQRADIMREDYTCLIRLRDKWLHARPRFEDRKPWIWRFWRRREN
jgi:hypothetical protein